MPILGVEINLIIKMTWNKISIQKREYSHPYVRFRTRVVTCKASCIYANRDLFELIFQPASSSKNPRYKRTDIYLWRPNSGGGGTWQPPLEATDTLRKLKIIMPSVTFVGTSPL